MIDQSADQKARALLEMVSAKPMRRMMLADMTPEQQELAYRMGRVGIYLIHFVGDWVAVTDAGYECITKAEQ